MELVTQKNRNRHLKAMIISLLLIPPAWGCNPNQDCMTEVRVPCPTWKEPLRSCLKRVEDTLCAAARKVCQKDCKDINEDANSYIFGFQGEKQRIRTEITTIDSAILSENQHEQSFQKLDKDSREVLMQLEKAGQRTLALIPKVATLDQFLRNYQLHEASLTEIIDSAKTAEDPLVNLMGALLEKSLELESTTNDLFDAHDLDGTLQRIALVFRIETERLRKQISTIDLSKNQTQENRSSLETKRQQRLAEIQEIEYKMYEQEKRKCPPW